MNNLRLLLICLYAIMVLPAFSSDQRKPGAATAAKDYINKHLYLARLVHRESGIPLPLILAVAGLESNWGRSELARYANNHFGIKAKDWEAAIYCKTTTEYYYGSYVASETEACFRRYRLIRDSYMDFYDFLRSRPYYRKLFEYSSLDYRSWAVGLQQANYGTDPNYASKLLRIIYDYRLDEIR